MSIELSPILLRYSAYTLAFQCPGCDQRHLIYEKHPTNTGPAWHWNKDVNKPTFEPSLLVEYPWWVKDTWEQRRCHSFIRDGMIQFLSDCTHALAGKTVPIPPVN